MPEPGPRKEIPAVSVRPLQCPNCGATVTVRAFGRVVNVVCGSCHSVLDAQHPEVQILQKFQAAQKYIPQIPLGARGKLRGVLYEAIGFQRRAIEVDGLTYGWDEYLLFNPYKGFRYLTEYQGHWNDTAALRSLPETVPDVTAPVRYLGQTYRHFQTDTAKTIYVLGEFPWQVRVGETVEVTDYVCPPRMLSSETTAEKEVTWSLGEYMSGADIWKIFSLPGHPPPPAGVYENQPSPLGGATRAIWQFCSVFLAAALLLLLFNVFTAQDRQVFSHRYFFNASSVTEPSFVTDMFELTGRASPVRVETKTNVDNNWIYMNYALINDDTGQAYDFGREASYYSGYDSDGSWSEGSRNDSVVLPSIPSGHYYLRIEPEGDRGHGPVVYTVTVTRGVTVFSWFFLALVLLFAPALLLTWRSMNFEHRRWRESDHAPASGSAALASFISRGGE